MGVGGGAVPQAGSPGVCSSATSIGPTHNHALPGGLGREARGGAAGVCPGASQCALWCERWREDRGVLVGVLPQPSLPPQVLPASPVEIPALAEPWRSCPHPGPEPGQVWGGDSSPWPGSPQSCPSPPPPPPPPSSSLPAPLPGPLPHVAHYSPSCSGPDLKSLSY